MGQVKKKEVRKNQQNVNIDWIINSPDPTPIAFFRLTHPTARSRAIDTYKKCFNLALNRSKGANLDKLKAVNNNEEIMQQDWEIWLKEKKAIQACRMSHDTNLQIQKDFAITMKTIAGATKNDIGEHNNFTSGIPKRLKFDNSDINEVDDIETQSIHSGLTGYSPNNPFFIPVKDDASGENDVFDSSYHTRSEESNDDIELEQKEKIEFQYEWFVGPGIKEFTLNENDNKWTVGTIDVSNLLLEYRNFSVKKASEKKIENAVEILSLNCIFLLDENLSTGIPEMIGPASLKAIFENIRSEYTPYHLSDKDVIRCHEISKIANKNFQGCKSLLRKWQKEVEENDDDLVLEVFESVADAREDSFVHEVFAPIISPFFINSNLKCPQMSWIRRPTENVNSTPCFREEKQISLLTLKLKATNTTLKIGNEMKDMLDKCIEDGVNNIDLTICGILVEGFQCSVFAMDLKFDAIYRMILLGKFFLPQNIHNLNVLSIAIEELMQTKSIISRSAELCFQSVFQCNKDPSITSTIPATPIRNRMARPSFHTPIRVPTNHSVHNS
ncbi:1746_t:CDS:10 [Gigaspora rosea]|nr:1746_t:CDS:10 [Gigaspora rosea]